MVIRDDESVSKLLTVKNGIRAPSITGDEKRSLKVTDKAGKFEKTPGTTMETKLYRRRWFQLGLFVFYGAVNNMQWIQFTIIANVISRYYGVSSSAVDWTSIIFYVAYVVMFFPASYVMDRVGLRWTCLIGAIGTSVGSWIKVFGVSPDRFPVVFIGQALVASAQIFVLNGPPRLAAYWFGPNEVATATAIGCFGGLAGASLFFLIIPIVVKNHETIEDIGEELSISYFAVAVACTVVTVALFLFFQDEPRLPPSEARALKKISGKYDSKGFWSSFRRILTNRSFLLLWNSFGINMGFLNATCTLLNPLFLVHFENGEADAGRLGLLMTFWGNFGSIVFGMILDKTKKFKALNIFIYVFALVGEILFAIGLIMEIKWLVFVSIGVIGIFTISYGSIGFELSAEATYPEPEELCSSLLNAAQQAYGTALALLVGGLLRTYGDTAAHVCLTSFLALGLTLTFFSKNERRRQNARGDMIYNPVVLLEAVKSDQIGKIIKNKYTPRYK